ncbi:MAG: hypothetical protein ACON5H_01020 [Akkermansiaceae bacterium]
MNAIISLLKVLPPFLKIAWVLLLVGMLSLAAGYFTGTPWQSYSGLECLIVGYVMVILDMLKRERRRGDVAGFYAGAILAPLIALMILTFVALLGAIVLAVQSMRDGFSESHAMRLLHFLGILFAFLVVSGISTLAMGARAQKKTEPNEILGPFDASD